MPTFAAFGIGLATRSVDSGKVLDTWFPFVAAGGDAGTAVGLAAALEHGGGSASLPLAVGVLDDTGIPADEPVTRAVLGVTADTIDHPQTRTERIPVATFIEDLHAPPADVHDAYLRLHLLSHRLVRPHGANLDGLFGILNNVVWTELGPCDPDDFESVRLALRSAGREVRVTSIDKFPRMTDYVVPSGVRIADAARVRLGAHLGHGTTVMHEGFVNFNAGTLGASMVEGRISAGVVVGDGSDVGGGASIMGTLSGGGSEVISVGENALIGANAGIGISLGDRCIVEAGLYITAGTKIALPDGEVVKARDLSGRADLLYRRDSQTGQVVALPRRDPTDAGWHGLNTDLHTNQ